MSVADGIQLGMAMRAEARKRAMQDEIAALGREQASNDPGFTSEQGMQLEAAAKSGMYDVAYDPNKGGYTVTAKSDPNSQGVITPSQRTTFLGKTYDKQLSDDEITNARQQAMAGVLEKHGDIEGGSALRRNVLQNRLTGMQIDAAKAEQERAGARFAWEKEAKERDDSYRNEVKSIYEDSTIGQQNNAFTAAQQKYADDMAEYRKKVESGDSSAIQPAPPKRPLPGVADAIGLQARMALAAVRAGKSDGSDVVKAVQALKLANQEGWVQLMGSIQRGAPIGAAFDSFNQQGQEKLKFVGSREVKREDGTKSYVIDYTDQDGNQRTVDTAAELGKFDKLKPIYEEMAKAAELAKTKAETEAIPERLKNERITAEAHRVSAGAAASNARSAAERTAIAREEFDAGSEDRSVSSQINTLAKQLAATKDPAKRDEIRQQMDDLQSRTRPKTQSGHDPADVAKAERMVRESKDGLTMDVAMDNIILKPGKEYDELVKESIKQGNGPKQAHANAVESMSLKGWEQAGGGLWRRSGSGGGGQLPTPKSPAEVDKLAPGTRFKAPDGSIRVK